MELVEQDYLNTARSRITHQFKEADNLDILMRIWLEGYQEVQETLLAIQLINDVDLAEGVQLDVIGDIVGQPREVVDISSTGFFGFEQDPGAKSFGSLENASGGLYYSVEDPDSGNILLADPLYRLFIKAKIINNNTGGHPEDVIAAAGDLFQTDTVELLEGDPDGVEPAVFTLYIGRPWNDSEETVYPGLDETALASRLLPKPAGVRIEFINVGVTETLNAVDNWSTASDQLYTLANITYPATIGDV